MPGLRLLKAEFGFNLLIGALLRLRRFSLVLLLQGIGTFLPRKTFGFEVGC